MGRALRNYTCEEMRKTWLGRGRSWPLKLLLILQGALEAFSVVSKLKQRVYAFDVSISRSLATGHSLGHHNFDEVFLCGREQFLVKDTALEPSAAVSRLLSMEKISVSALNRVVRAPQCPAVNQCGPASSSLDLLTHYFRKRETFCSGDVHEKGISLSRLGPY